LAKYATTFKIPNEAIDRLANSADQPFYYMLRSHHSDFFSQELRTSFENWYDRMEILAAKSPVIPYLETPHFKAPTENSKTFAKFVAEEVRQLWNMGSDPVSDPVNLTESLGIFIKSVDFKTDRLMAITGKKGKSGVAAMLINTNTELPIERQRFSIFHELAHLIAHDEDFEENPNHSGYGENKDPREAFADAFAGNFLVPEKELIRIIRLIQKSGAGDQMIFLLKLYFKVSYQVIFYRLFETEFITGRNLSQMFHQWKAIYGNREPCPLTESLRFAQEDVLIDSFSRCDEPNREDVQFSNWDLNGFTKTTSAPLNISTPEPQVKFAM